MMNKETIDTLRLIGTLTMFVGGPTTIAAGLATKLAIRGGIALGRRLAAGAISGAVATTAAFIYMNAQGGGGSSNIDGFASVTQADLEVEVLTLSYIEDDGARYFEFNDATSDLSLEEAKSLIGAAITQGKTKEIQIIDRANGKGTQVIQLGNFSESSGLTFSITDKKEEDSE